MRYLLTLTLALLLSICAIKAQVTYTGSVSVVVGEVYGPYVNDSVSVVINTNDDETIDITFCQYSLSQTAIGDLTLSEYTVSNIAYDVEKGANYRDYTNDGLIFHFSAVNEAGETTFDSDYGFDKKGGNVLIEFIPGGGIKVINHFQPGMMPFGIESIFEGLSTVSSIERVDCEQSARERILDLQGRPLPQLRRGLNIVNGRKIFHY